MAASAQYTNKVNAFVQSGYTVPYASGANMSQYYHGGFATEMHIVASLSKRKSDARFSFLFNTGYNYFGGRTWEDYDSYGNLVLYKSDPIMVLPVHAGLRLDIGNVPKMKNALYMSQDWGYTFIEGPKGGTRFGHTFNLGFLARRFDMVWGINTWKGSTGNKFHYFSFRMGYMIF